MERKWGLVVAACALGGLWGCGGGSGGGSTGPSAVATPTPAPTPVPPVVLLSDRFTTDYVVIFRTLSVSASGLLEITVDWTSASNDLDVALVRGTCTSEMFEADTCDYIGFADSLTAKPEKLRMNVTAGPYTPMVVNFGPGDESGTIQVVFTAGASVSAAAQEGTPRTRRLKKPARFVGLP